MLGNSGSFPLGLLTRTLALLASHHLLLHHSVLLYDRHPSCARSPLVPPTTPTWSRSITSLWAWVHWHHTRRGRSSLVHLRLVSTSCWIPGNLPSIIKIFILFLFLSIRKTALGMSCIDIIGLGPCSLRLLLLGTATPTRSRSPR